MKREVEDLFLIATPIGNLKDISLRALDILRIVDIVFSEDTRKTGFLMHHYEIKKPLVPFFEHNEVQMVDQIISLVKEGKKVALVTDAGTPGISDPGFRLVRSAIINQVKFTLIPGPSALIMALVMSGLPTHSFTFRGFPPRKSGQRKNFLKIDVQSPHTLIFYESPHRILGLLEDCLAVFGDRQAVVANDLTKMFESFSRGYLSEIIKHFEGIKPLGEYVLLVNGANINNQNPREDE